MSDETLYTASHWVQCPYCGQAIEIVVDCSVDDQSYVEDCSVCCQGIEFAIHFDAQHNQIFVNAKRLDDTY